MVALAAGGLGASKQDVRDLYTGKIKWTDLDNNPYVPFFAFLKEIYDAGYLPENWWTREWGRANTRPG